MAKAQTIGARLRTFGCRRHRRTNQRQYSKIVPADGDYGCQLEKRRLRYVAVFWAALRTSQCLSVCATKWACRRQTTMGVSRFCVLVDRDWLDRRTTCRTFESCCPNHYLAKISKPIDFGFGQQLGQQFTKLALAVAAYAFAVMRWSQDFAARPRRCMVRMRSQRP